MHEAAFNRALDFLTDSPNSTNMGIHSSNPVKKLRQSSYKRSSGDGGPVVDQLLREIDSTQHPGLTSTLKVLDRSLMVLEIALTDHHVDGLTPVEISRILTEKFRIGTTDAAVNMAIGKETNLVNRVPEGKGYRYKIMGPGQEYLKKLSQEDSIPTSRLQRKRKPSRRREEGEPTDHKPAIIKNDGKEKEHPKGTRKSSSSVKVGVKAALLELLNSGFFSEGRTSADVQTYLSKRRGLSFGIAQLRLAMLRLVREQKLERDEDQGGNYEYKESSRKY